VGLVSDGLKKVRLRSHPDTERPMAIDDKLRTALNSPVQEPATETGEVLATPPPPAYVAGRSEEASLLECHHRQARGRRLYGSK